jgi:hypothetical protein
MRYSGDKDILILKVDYNIVSIEKEHPPWKMTFKREKSN